MTGENIILHCFCDASKQAYASVIYITIGEGINKTGQLVACKTKVAPIQLLSIPQLEMPACLLFTKLYATVTSSLEGVVKISKSYFWCDAIDCLFWIKECQKRRNVFVENRVRQIRDTLSLDSWRHIPGNLNPADFPSRGFECVTGDINENLQKWIVGPEFIYEPDDRWPKDINTRYQTDEQNGSKFQLEEKDENINELVLSVSRLYEEQVTKTERLSKVNNSVLSTTVNGNKHVEKTQIQNVINSARFSSLSKLLRVTAYVMRFVFNLSNKSVLRKLGNLSVDVKSAEVPWIQSMQKVFYESNQQFRWLKTHLGIYIDKDSILRCKGRLNNSTMLSKNERNPILLPKKGYLLTLIIRKSHLDSKHGNIKDTLTSVRARFWMLNDGRRQVANYVTKCVFLSKIRWSTLQVARNSPTAVFPCVSELSVRNHWRGLRRSIYGKTNL